MADNLREKLPTKDSIISSNDKVILSQDNSNTTVDEFGRITFNEENFPTIFLDSTTERVAALSGVIETTTRDRLSSFETPEILALQYKHTSNAEGDVIGIAGHAVTNINFEEHVNTINPIDLTGGLQISQNAATKTIRDRKLASSDILLSPGVYRVECTGTFTLVGIAGGFDENGDVFGNGYKAYVVLELHKETQPGEILLYSTPAVEYANETNINDTTSSVTCYMYGYISICNPSILKLKAKTAGEYAIGTVDPDSAGDFPDTFINPVQIVFEKVCEDPFCMEVATGGNNVFPGFVPFETTTLPPVIPPPPPLIPEQDPTVTTTPPPPGAAPGGGGAPPPPAGSGGGGGDPGDARPSKDSDIVSCESVGFCTSSPYEIGLPKWGYLNSNGEFQRTTIEQAGWSWFTLLDPDPGSVVDRNYNSRVIFEGGKRRHNGGIMGKKPEPGDAIIFKTFPAASPKYSFSSVASRDRGECDYCRQGGIGNPAPTSQEKRVVNKWKLPRKKWCHLDPTIKDETEEDKTEGDESSLSPEEAEEAAEAAAKEAAERGEQVPIDKADGSGVKGNRLPGERVVDGRQLVDVDYFVGPHGFTIGPITGRLALDTNGNGYTTILMPWNDVVGSDRRQIRPVNKTFREAQDKFQRENPVEDEEQEEEEVDNEEQKFEDDDPGEDKCAVTLTWPCFVRDFGTDPIAKSDMETGSYNGGFIKATEGGVSIEPERVAKDLEDIFGDATNIESRSVNVDKRIELKKYVDKKDFFTEEIKQTFSTLERMEQNYVDGRYRRLIGIPFPNANQAKEIAKEEFKQFDQSIKLLWRTEKGDADDDSKDIAVIFEDKILPLLKNIQSNPPTSYEGIYTNQNILKLFSRPLEIIKDASGYDTVSSQAKVDESYKKFFEAINNRGIDDNELAPFSKFYELAKFIANTNYYDVITKRETPGGYAGVEQWRDATNIPPNIYFNKWWESKLLDQIAKDLESNPFRDLIAGPGKDKSEYTTGNCCMTKNAMIIEAYYWNLDQFKASFDDEYEFIPWWFKFRRSQVEDDDGSKKKTHKYDQDSINKYEWIKQPVDLLGIMKHPHPHADTAEATITQTGKFVLGCQD